VAPRVPNPNQKGKGMAQGAWLAPTGENETTEGRAKIWYKVKEKRNSVEGNSSERNREIWGSASGMAWPVKRNHRGPGLQHNRTEATREKKARREKTTGVEDEVKRRVDLTPRENRKAHVRRAPLKDKKGRRRNSPRRA